MTSGEKRLARRLQMLLEDDYLCWFDIPVGRTRRYPDFIILHPGRGLLFLEVKDWKLENIKKITKQSVSLLTSNGLKQVLHPLEQARQYAYTVVNELCKDLQLTYTAGKYKGNLLFPYGVGVVFPNISRSRIEQVVSEYDRDSFLPDHSIIYKDEMTDSVNAEEFQEQLWGMFNYQFGNKLTLPQVDRIRWHLFPEMRIDVPKQSDLFNDNESPGVLEQAIPDLVKVMDVQQEQLARSLGEGHRVIHGVAGSGKTLILGFRCLYLARLLHKPILVVCYNITLAAKLRTMMEKNGISEKVNVYHFHDWCGEQLRLYNVDKPKYDGQGYVNELVSTVIENVEKEVIPRGQYGAVMVDEGHDFEAAWLKLIVQMVDPDTNSLLLLYDDAQSIYSRKNELDFSLSSIGVQARGRTTILRLNYRNTDEILQFAYQFLKKYLSPGDSDEDHIPLVEPEYVGRHGPKPYCKKLSSFQNEIQYITSNLKRLNSEGMPWSDMCVTYHANWMGEKLYEQFIKQGITVKWLSSQQDKKKYRPDDNSVKLMTMHSSKGLEFPMVVIVGLGYFPNDNVPVTEQAKLLYVAMTRSTKNLLITAHQTTEFVKQLT